MPTHSIHSHTTLKQLRRAWPGCGPVLERLGAVTTRDEDSTLAEFCVQHGLESRAAVRLLAAMRGARQHLPAACVELMTLAQLCDHLEIAHHDLQDELKRLDRLTKVVVRASGERHPTLWAIRRGFVTFQRRFKAHLRRESEQLFPIIRRWETTTPDARGGRGVEELPLRPLDREHDQADEAMVDLRGLVTRAGPSSPARTALQSVAEAVIRLERSVHEQIYQEHRVLFPKTTARWRVARAA